MSTGNEAVDRMVAVEQKFNAEVEGKELLVPEKISILLKMCTEAELGIRAFNYLEQYLILGKENDS